MICFLTGTESLVCCSENRFVFNSASQFAGKQFTPAEFQLSSYIQSIWAGFAYTQDGWISGWPNYNSTSDASVWLDTTSGASGNSEVVEGYHAVNCDFWDALGYSF